jgi:hypothetical protein
MTILPCECEASKTAFSSTSPIGDRGFAFSAGATPRRLIRPAPESTTAKHTGHRFCQALPRHRLVLHADGIDLSRAQRGISSIA